MTTIKPSEINRFLYAGEGEIKRYRTYDSYLRGRYGGKVFKVSLNAGFSCPHSGCIFCAGADKFTVPPDCLIKQFNEKKSTLHKKWNDAKYIAYFQSGTNTYAPIQTLRSLYESVLGLPDVIGLDIATRPDCLEAETLEYLAELSARTDVTVELGLQTVHDTTARRINRGYDADVFFRAYNALSSRGIRVSIHLINSLPGETTEMMLETVKVISSLCPAPFGVKIHMLNVIRDTQLEQLYKEGGFTLLSRDQYIDTVINQLELLPPQTVVLRITGEAEEEKIIVPDWVNKKFSLINDIDKEMLRRASYQGRFSGLPYLRENMEDSIMEDTGGNEFVYRKRLSLTNILSTAKRLLDLSIHENGVYADFTAGNGHDTAYLSKKCPSGKIYSFDIQESALEAVRKRLSEENCGGNVELILDSHENFDKYIPGNIDGGIFNLGYRPGGDKNITTLTESTENALKKALGRLNTGGVIVVVIYPGHPEGEREGQIIAEMACRLSSKEYDCLCHRIINIPDSPYIIAFGRKA